MKQKKLTKTADSLKNSPPSSLQNVCVFDRLEIGPVKLQPDKLTAPYRLLYGNKNEEVELIYKFEEDVFDPSSRESMNLAEMIAAQVSINYGLFCRSLTFHGSYDETDQKFIREMAENTAKEIYIKKFMEENPFLTGEASRLIFEKEKNYLKTQFEFIPSNSAGSGVPWKLWAADAEKLAVLSSGGKDSLLSYALLNENGFDVHPVFINESGRHWFTALNAYRYFKSNEPNTSRVWTNSDRIFNWMLRRMPFIRKDYASIRADEYPIRLWTVAVFLFGALPLLKKRNIGKLIIGDEFDTTVMKTYRGVNHYDGLFDQSRSFDNALSRYFLRKGWGVSQFSILRPLSELLIEKILAVRYPALQQHQVSCHAAHKEGPLVKPCGKCEKCRRIVGMLIAFGADPQHCGYTEKQIKQCLEDIARKGIHQEAPGISHLKWLLHQKKAVEFYASEQKTLKPCTEIMHLRFDSKRSPINGIPVEIRKPVYDICLQYTDGALKKIAGHWRPFDLFLDPDLSKNFPFELPDKSSKQVKTSHCEKKITRKDYIWAELTWPEIEKRLKIVDVAILPIGSIEQHGLHLPLDTDAFDARYLAEHVADACSDPKPLALPLISYGVSYEHDEFAGTISIKNDTLAHLVYEIGMSVSRNGIKKLVIINGHGGNIPAVTFAAQMINRDAGVFVCVDTGETSDVDVQMIADTPNDIHAGEIETSAALAVRPELVQMSKASRLTPRFSSRYLNFTSKRGVIWYSYTRKFSQSGVIGDPTRATAGKGRKIWKTMIAHLVSLVEDLKNLTLDEIYQKRY